MVVGGIQALSANLLAPPDGEVTDIASLQKEGETIFALTYTEQHKTDLMHKPDSRGNCAVSRTLDAAAPYHDFQDLALDGRTPMSHHRRGDDSHGLSCMSGAFVEIAAAMGMSNDRVPG